jgi:hypothetical protein
MTKAIRDEFMKFAGTRSFLSLDQCSSGFRAGYGKRVKLLNLIAIWAIDRVWVSGGSSFAFISAKMTDN